VRVFLLRHAIAAPRDPERWPQDRARPLTGDGRRKMERAARGIAALVPRVDLVLTSPFERALDTARIATAAYGSKPEMRVLKPLAPGGGHGGVLAVLADLPADASVLLVGHEPDLSGLAAALLLDHRAELPVDFRKGGLCRIDFDGPVRPGDGRLAFHLPPKVLRRIRGA
jgi:phosphohistidine phosphatase